MVDKEMLVNAIEELIDTGCFFIKKIDYDENNFGNFCIELFSKDSITIRFIRDKGAFWCEIGKNGECYFIEDVFSLLKIDITDNKSNVYEFLRYMSKLIASNIKSIFNAFDAENFEYTHNEIKALATQRAMGMFKI